MAKGAGFTHPYVPNAAPEPRRRLLAAIGVGDIDELYASVPADLRLQGVLDLPPPLPGEHDLRRHLEGILARNRSCRDLLNVRGAGCWQHFVPALCDEIVGRGEFLTAYAGGPYSDHGKNQALFEFQSLLGELVGMEVVSPPTYDAGAAACSAIAMACRVTGRRGILVPALMHPDRLSQLRGFTQPAATITTVRQDPDTGLLDLADLRAKLSSAIGAVYIENPGYLGSVETGAPEAAALAHAAGALVVVAVDPISLGVIAAPADYGADIVTGDLQPLGIRMYGGGGCAGFIASRDEERFVHEYPTMLITPSPAAGGGIGFGWSTQERTSYDKRHEATDYYGTTQWLWGIGAAVYLSLMGPKGMVELGQGIMARARYATKGIAAIPGVRVPGQNGVVFKEFVVDLAGTGKTVAAINRRLLGVGIMGGHDLGTEFPELAARMMVCFTEVHDRADIDRFTAALAEAVR
ncbi:MAG: aminomethyl-transferring glycine dehydrogenase subunit GcvPA [Alphaproteobacteria bacterium]|nr:aminomethyl-transferring glycine dehydrogenase subunit GcvPA [Alphaproteobacteria bacterium]